MLPIHYLKLEPSDIFNNINSTKFHAQTATCIFLNKSSLHDYIARKAQSGCTRINVGIRLRAAEDEKVAGG